MKRIIIVGDLSSTNLGDPLLANCCDYIVKRINDGLNIPIEMFDIAGRRIRTISTHSSPSSIKRKSFIGIIRNEVEPIIKWALRDRKVFDKRLSQIVVNDTTFVIAGGALISSSLFYALRLNRIVFIAKRNSCRVIFNSIGVEKSIHGFGLSKYLVRHYLKQKEVVAFSTRDHLEDIPFLTKRRDFYRITPDPGLFASELYGIKRKNSQLVGLSVISYQAYQSIVSSDRRAKEVTSDYLISFWSAIINHLRALDLDFRILTNGGKADFEMALKLANALQLDKEKYLLPQPQTPSELVDQISRFQLIIAHRLHANIVSSSLNIPVISLIWSDKVRVFAEMMGNQFAFWPDLDKVSSFDMIIKDCIRKQVDSSAIKKEIITHLSDNLKREVEKN